MGEVDDRPLPWPVLYIFGPEYEGFAYSLGTKRYVKDTVMICEAASPRASPVFILSVAECLGITSRQNVIDIIDDLPIDEIGRFHDRDRKSVV